MGQVFHLTLGAHHISERPSQLLAGLSKLSRQQIKQAMQKGAVWLTHSGHTRRLRRDRSGLAVGDQLHLYYNPEILQQETPAAHLIADEHDYSVWYKPPGMRSQGSKWSDHTTLSRCAEQQLQPQRTAFIVHRLDRFADGLMLLAHSKGMARQLAALFEQRLIDKHYQVWVHGQFPPTPAGLRMDQPLDGKPAVSIATRIDSPPQQQRSQLRVAIETGRKHQIRRHLAAAGYPVIGDRLYGNDHNNELHLTCVMLAFVHPLSQQQKRYELPQRYLKGC